MTSDLTDVRTLPELALRARTILPQAVWDYIDGGAGEEFTLAANRLALREATLLPRVLVDVSSRESATTVLGTRLAAPIGIAPMAYHRLVHCDGEAATVRASGAESLLTVVSTFSSRSIEDITAEATGPVWFQLYQLRDRTLTEELVMRAEKAGCSALVVTADAPIFGRRDRDARNGFRLPLSVEPGNLRGVSSLAAGRGLAETAFDLMDPGRTWASLDRLREITRLPIVIKGILHPRDAEQAARSGCAGLIVSNHGGRQLDGAISSLDALAEIAPEVRGDLEIYVDGGFRRGVDVLKAVALGARLVLVGRPVLWGLALAGEAGVRHVLRHLKEELDLAMALTGCTDINDIDRSLVRFRTSGGR